MAITAIEYSVFRSMRQQNLIPLGGDILEIGESNWYGDVPIEQLAQDIYLFAREEEKRDLFVKLDEIVRSKREKFLFEIAKVFWQVFWHPSSMTAIDFHGTEKALKIDLNYPIELPRRFHSVINLGTLEHIFNVAQLMKTVHDYTLPNGLMIHEVPFTGWYEHGFYNIQPTFFWDVALFNGYGVVLFLYAELKPLKLIQLLKRESIIELVKNKMISENSLLFCILKKPPEERPFRIPIQGYYAGTISPELAEAWRTLR